MGRLRQNGPVMGFDTSPLVIPAVASDPAGLLEIDADDRIVEANLTARRWLKMEPNQVVGSPLQWILREPARAEQGSERLPDSFDLHSSDGLVRAVLVAFGPTAMDGHRSVVLFDAERQMEFAREIQNRHTQVERPEVQGGGVEKHAALVGRGHGGILPHRGRERTCGKVGRRAL